jgi:hypothetical protein
VGGLHTSLNTGFLSIFDFGGAFKDGGPPFINVDTNKREPNISYILAIVFNYLNEHLWFWWYFTLKSRGRRAKQAKTS